MDLQVTANIRESTRVLAISGGVGGAKLALGLSHLLGPEQLTIVANTADDFEHLGLHISPDLDTLMYTLAGLDNPVQGWGLDGESWTVMDALEALGGETWFRLGDRDLATHLYRSAQLRAGRRLSEVTRDLCSTMLVEHPIVPMTDDVVATMIETGGSLISFQDYFVKQSCAPSVQSISFVGAERAQPHPLWFNQLFDSELDAIIVCPSNPFVSVDPILSLPGVRDAIRETSARVIAVSPIIGGQAVKGPAALMLKQLGHDVSAWGVGEYYREWVDTLVIDQLDATLSARIEDLGLKVEVLPTMMNTLEERVCLAAAVLEMVKRP